METLINQIKHLPISDTTARLIACQRLITTTIHENITHALCQMYGATIGEEIMEKTYTQYISQINEALRQLTLQSITCNTGQKNITQI